MTQNISNSTSDNRPLSPHLGVYRPQISSTLSILHRITGFALFIGVLLMTWWVVGSVYAAFNNDNDSVWNLFDSIIGRVFLFGWTLAFYYHLFNGLRHLYWDTGRGFALRSVDLSGITVLVATLVFSVGSWVIAYL